MEALMTIALDHYEHDARPVRHLRAVPDPAPATHFRLTRRGKTVVLVATLAVIALLVVMFGPSTLASNEAGTPQETTTVTVMPGTTLWDIATEANPNGDIRKTVDDIVRLNSLPNGSALQMGSEIAVPVYH
jgi:cell division protein YceG involved in septum cleavage